MNRQNPAVDAYFTRASKWKEESLKLRAILLAFRLGEELKWGKPCYTFEDNNIIVMQGFKEYCALLFLKGVLMKDPHGVLQKTGVNTRVGRQLRFTDIGQIKKMGPILKDCIREAIEVEKSGLKVTLEKVPPPAIPEEFQSAMDEIPELKTAFFALTPGRQRGYLIFLSAAAQSKTRASRVEKCMPRILDGKGLND